jgi:Tfp pilus assembly protein PilN
VVRINLLPAEILERRKYERFYPYIFVAGAIALAFVLVTWLGLQFLVGQRVEQLQQTDEAINQLNAQAAALSIFEEQQQSLVGRQEVASKALASRCDMGKMLEEMSLVLPDSLWIEEITCNEADGLVIKGYSPDALEVEIDESYKSIAAGLVRLNSLPDLYDVWLKSASSKSDFRDFQGDESDGTSKVVQFEATAKIKKPVSGAQQSAVPAPPIAAGQ